MFAKTVGTLKYINVFLGTDWAGSLPFRASISLSIKKKTGGKKFTLVEELILYHMPKTKQSVTL